MTALSVARLRRAARRLIGDLPSTGPDFFVVGATRAGTTWLHHALRAHPDIFLPEAKELQYFNRDRRYRTDLAGYRPLFRGWRGERVVGEATPLYMVAGGLYDDTGAYRIGGEDDAIARIARHFPAAKLVVSLRDPATRIPSIYEKNLRQRKLDEPLAQLLERELAGEPSVLNLLYLNDYRTHLENIFARFTSEQVKIVLFEDWRSDPKPGVEGLQRFLGVDPVFSEPVAEGAANRRERFGELDEAAIRRLCAVPEPLMAAVLAALGPGRTWVEDLIGRELPWR